MNSKVSEYYYRKNHLYARKMIMPETREVQKGSCLDCKYYVEVRGQREKRRVCVSGVRAYRTRAKRVPQSMDVMELILLLGKESLENLINKGDVDKMACGDFEIVK